MLFSLEPLGTEVFLPGILLGWHLGPEASHRLRELGDSPSWFLHVEQQAGGPCMQYPECAGMLLRFEANRKCFRQPADPLIRGLRFIAQDPNLQALADEYPLLYGMVGTWGLPYDADTLHALSRYLAPFLDLPELESGIEAYLHFEECDLLAHFARWKALQCTLRPPESRQGSTYRMNPKTVYYISDRNSDDVVREDVVEVNQQSLADLVRVGAEVGLHAPCRAILMWENSD